MSILHRLKIQFRNTLLVLFCCSTATATARAAPDPILVALPEHRLSANVLAVIVNDLDPLSVRIGAYYQRARGIPARNMLHVAFRPDRAVIPREEFRQIKTDVEENTPPGIQAYAITWASPYRVECMSITTAFAFGFSPEFCSTRRCAATRPSPLFNRSTTTPWTDFGIRPTMAVAANTFEAATALIDRGIQSDNSRPSGTAYLVITGDKARDVRSVNYAKIQRQMESWIETEIVHSPGLRNVDDILFYFTGTTHVPYLNTLHFVPGAIADHLTSAGGKLNGSGQMSALHWLEAGATGSYGTVVEPCNHLGKFPNPGLAMEVYSTGRTLLEAYWQSVQQPGEGIFIGEPLAAPFDGYEVSIRENDILLRTRALSPGLYRLYVSDNPVGPYSASVLVPAHHHQETFILPKLDAAYYRLEIAKPVKALLGDAPASRSARRGAPTATPTP